MDCEVYIRPRKGQSACTLTWHDSIVSCDTTPERFGLHQHVWKVHRLQYVLLIVTTLNLTPTKKRPQSPFSMATEGAIATRRKKHTSCLSLILKHSLGPSSPQGGLSIRRLALSARHLSRVRQFCCSQLYLFTR